MPNFTPINPKKITHSSPSKKKFNLLLWGNLIMVVLISIIGLIYYNNQLQSKKQKAASRYPFGCIRGKNVYNYLERDNNCAWVKSNKKSSFQFGQYFFCKANGGPGCPRSGVPADEQYVFRPPSYGECFKKNCGTEQIDFKFSDGTECFYSRIDDDCGPQPTTPLPTPTLTNTPVPTNTITPTNTPVPTNTITPTNTPTTVLTYTPTPTSVLINSPTPTEIIIVQITNTPTQPPPTSTPLQQIAQTGDLRSLWVFALPISVILLGLLL